MATSNQERIGRGLEVLAKALEPRAVKALEAAYGQDWWDRLDREALDRSGHGVGTNFSDPQFVLNAMANHWGPAFSKTLGRAERSFVGELQDVRNRWAHPRADRPFTAADTERALDTMTRLATAAGAPDEASVLGRMRADVLRAQWDAAQKHETKRQAALPLEGSTSAGLRPWRDVIAPHPDVAAGRYAQAEFAADLGQVHRGEGGAEYRDPRAFFERTFLTAGLSELIVGALQRLAGRPEGEPVVELQTSFGGGKTHSMLALYHLLSGIAPASLPGIEPILGRAGVAEIPPVRRVVLVGTALSPAQSRRRDECEVRTLWGELAWQLGGAEAYEALADADAHGASPGTDLLRELLQLHGPALILVDEWVTFIRQLWADSTLPAGSFDANISFAQALTEAVKQTDRSLLVASLPSSDIEKGGEGGRYATEQLKHVVGRVESPWRPASPEEGFEIVRRRLFGSIPPELMPARDAVVQQFADLYARQSGDFPPESKEAAYQRRMTSCYPIHPELFDQLFGAWSTLEKFQQTRGVLRLMASVIHALWERGDQSPLILPASVPIDETRVQSELTRYLEEQWVPVIARDVDGEGSVPLALDRENPATLGRLSAARRVARTIYVGSAPTANAAARGIDDRRIKLGCVQPGETAAVFGDALRRLSDRSTYLYDNAGRYWFSTQPSVNRLARDRAAQLHDEDVTEEIRRRLQREQAERGQFARVHAAPRSAADVPDEDEAALVVLGPEAPHPSRSDVSRAREAARELLDERGTGPRRNRNMLVFLAPDADRLPSLQEATRQFLAWRSIDADRDVLTLDSFQLRQIETKRKEADDTVAVRIPETYQWLLVPTQPDPLGPINLDPTRVSGSGSMAERASARMRTDGALVTRFGGVALRLELDRHPDIWKDGHVELRRLWALFTQYVYLPRLRDYSVLLEAVRNGAGETLLWRSETFAYAATWDEATGRYRGLTGGRMFSPVMDGLSVIVRPQVAVEQMGREEPEKVPTPEAPGGQEPRAAGAGEYPEAGSVSSTRIAERVTRRFHGSVRLRDATRPSPEFSQLAEAVTAHLAGVSGARVSIRVEIEAERDEGFDGDTIRVVTENVRTLKFDDGSGFEDR